ncbi:metal-dependent transcriptional regulator [Salinirubrum litoreum]|uniref:Metal-dependent transcriptional regulator n=1 Tax=Salinirubrum litoreum TaxID=1126234 RepID=A0ABD5RAU1_9EURY|nr:metal-dependent transcriptional regulator [Salinirubrum litoreum]
MSRRPQYLLGLYVAEHRESPPVAPGVVASALDRSPATVIEAFREFESEGWLTYEPYEGATLTEAGRRRGEELHETYVTLSWFFRSVLGLEEYEREAMELAGVVSPDVAKRFAATLPVAVDESADVSPVVTERLDEPPSAGEENGEIQNGGE